MTSKNGGRKNLGTVVELAETGDDCTSPLIADSSEPSTHAPTVSAEGSRSSSINLAQAGSLTNTVTDDPTAGATDSMHDVESLGGYPRTFDLTSPSGFAAASSSNFQAAAAAQQSMPPRKRLGPLAQTRIGLYQLLNSVTVAGRSLNNRSRNSTSSATPASVNVIKTSTPSAAAAASSHASGDSKSRNPDSDIEAGPISDDEDGSENFFDMAPAEASTTSLRRKSNSSLNEDETTPSSSMDAAKKPAHTSVGRFCSLCCMRYSRDDFPKLRNCAHRSCQHCLSTYLTIQITESRVKVSCPECSELMHPNDITYILRNDPRLLEKYETFTLRRTLLNDPDARWCPAPDCGYAVIASYCAACPQLECQRPGCNTKFCYHCQGEWHDRLTCNEARKVRMSRNRRRSIAATGGSNGGSSSGPSFLNPRESILKPGDVKACPRCRTFIVKVDDGSCNHMVCAMCGAEFCWLCLKIITDLHYLSPTGCTFWGKRPWTRKKKLLWQIGTLIGAPVGIALIAGLAVPGIIFGVPVFVGRKTYQRFPQMSRIRRRVITAATVAGALVVSPVLAVMAVGVGVPIMLAYVYGVVPLSLCRNGGCGGGESGPQSPYGEEESPAESIHRANLENDLNSVTDPERSRLLNADGTSVGVSVHSGLSSEVASHRYNRNCRVHVDDGTSRRRPSIDSGVTSLGERGNFDGASVNAMAGSHYDKKSVHTVYSDGQEAQYDEAGSTKALAGSVFDAKSLTDSVGRHGVVFRDEKAPTSSTSRPLKISTSHPSVYPPPVPDDANECCCSELSANGAKPDEHHEGQSSHAFSSRLSTSMDAEEGQVDPYKVHAFMDNIKQILNDDAVDEPPTRPIVMKTFKKNPTLAHPPSSSTARHLRQPGITRTSSTKSGGTTVSAQVSEEGAHVVITPTVPPTAPEPEESNRMPSTPPTTTVLPRHSTPPSSRRPSFFARLFRRNKPST